MFSFRDTGQFVIHLHVIQGCQPAACSHVCKF